MDALVLIIIILALITLRDVVKWIALSRELNEIKELLRQIGGLPPSQDNDIAEHSIT